MNLREIFKSRWFELALRVGIGALFIYAGAEKLRDPQSFADSVNSFQMLPAALIAPFALALPIFEIGAGILIAIGWPRRIGAIALLVLSVMFCIALGQALVRGLDVNCGCFGPGYSRNPAIELTGDIVLSAACAFLYITNLNATGVRK
ncbi:MAG: DoxX family protein [Candidatus Binataceae bacterium]